MPGARRSDIVAQGTSSMRRGIRHGIVLATVLGTFVVTLLQPPLPQSPAYHAFGDTRAWMGVPNAWNVLSNLPFAVVGLLGLAVVFRNRGRMFHDAWERWPWAALFAGVVLTTLGSAWYHLSPGNASLVWDRLPMSIGFMGLVTAMVAERIGVPVARRLFVPLLVAGALTVVYWGWSEGRGAGDLRPYLFVQFGSLLVVVLLLVLYRGRYGGGGYVAAGLAAYLAAKVFEAGDQAVLAMTGIVSGHTLKHLAAAVAVGCLVVMLRVRVRSADQRSARSSSELSVHSKLLRRPTSTMVSGSPGSKAWKGKANEPAVSSRRSPLS
jgi:hypothetical protein